MPFCQSTKVNFHLWFWEDLPQTHGFPLCLSFMQRRVNATINAGNSKWFQHGSSIKRAKQMRPYLKCTNCWSKFCSVPVTLHKNNKRRGCNLLFILIRMSWECGLEAGLITPQEGARTHPHLANKLMKIICTARASIFQDYLIGWAEQLHHCLLPGSHHCDWANLNLPSGIIFDDNWAMQETQNGGTHSTGCYTTLIQIQRYCSSSRCQKRRQKRGYKRGNWETRQSWLIPPTLPSI